MVQRLVPEHSGKIVVGLTGGMGCGKSTVGHFFEELGAFVFDADQVAHEILQPGGPHYEEVARIFPEAVLPGDRGLDRKKIAGVIFADSSRRHRLETLAHPYVFQRFVEEANDCQARVAIMEAPLLFESGFHRFCDCLVVVKAEEEVITQRLKSKGYLPEEIMARQRAQMPLQDKIQQAHFVIDNSGTLEKTKREATQVWEKIVRTKGEK